MKTESKSHRSPWDAATAEATVDEALRLMKPTAHVTDEVKAALATELPGISGSVAEIAAMTPLRLASRLIGTEYVAEEDLFDIARELIASFRALLGTEPAQPQPAPAPAPPPVAPARAQSRKTPPGKPLTEDEYRKVVFGAAEARRDSMSGSVHLGATVIESFSTMSGNVHLDGTVVLGSSSTMSGGLSGTAYVPRGVSISTMSGSNRLVVRVRSYEDLARQAGLA
jgi:hypothetical protein